MKSTTFSKRFFMMIVLIFPVTNNVLADQGLWEDGKPTFVKTILQSNTMMDPAKSTILLTPLDSLYREPDSFKVTLGGVNWEWPTRILSLGSVTDIDAITLADSLFYLVSDAIGRRVYAVNPNKIEDPNRWTFGTDQVSSPDYIKEPVDVFAFEEDIIPKFLITDKGLHRVIKVNSLSRNIEWQYGDGTEGSDFNQLAFPSDAVRVPNSLQTLICDRGNKRIILVDEPTKQILWTWANVNPPLDPSDVECIGNGDSILVTDQSNHRILVVDRRSDEMVWQFGTGQAANSDSTLRAPTDADYLGNGHILISDKGNKRLIEVNFEKEIVWFYQELAELEDADRLSNGHTLVVSDRYPMRLGYTDLKYTSVIPRDLGRNVNFDKLSWDADLPEGTSIRFQLRSANDLGVLATKPWLGPDAVGTWYTEQSMPINSAHDGDRFYQFYVFLKTTDPLVAPVLNNVIISYHYFDTEKVGVINSSPMFPIGARNLNEVVIEWQHLSYTTKFPADAKLRDKVEIEVRIIDPKRGNLLAPVYVSRKADTLNTEYLSNVETLKDSQRVQLIAYLKTYNSAVTPVLKNWTMRWKYTASAKSQIDFVDSDGKPKKYYKATTTYPPVNEIADVVCVNLRDRNISSIRENIDVTISALKSGDFHRAILGRLPSGEFRLTPGVPLIISDSITPENSILEVVDKDTLVVFYTDPFDPNDKSVDSILVVQTSKGYLQIENYAGVKLDTVALGDTLYVRVTGESDQNISPAQDTIWVSMYDNATADKEDLMLLELPDGEVTFDTGKFRSKGIMLVRSTNGIENDGYLQTWPGHHVGVDYQDNVLLQQNVWIPSSAEPPDIFIYLGGAPFDITFAPNPFNETKDTNFRLRVASSTGSLKVRFIEIFNFAGEKLRELDVSQLTFGPGDVVPKEQYGIAEHWWNLRNKSGHIVASGTYWAKVHADLINDDTGNVEQISAIRKFVIIR